MSEIEKNAWECVVVEIQEAGLAEKCVGGGVPRLSRPQLCRQEPQPRSTTSCASSLACRQYQRYWTVPMEDS